MNPPTDRPRNLRGKQAHGARAHDEDIVAGPHNAFRLERPVAHAGAGRAIHAPPAAPHTPRRPSTPPVRKPMQVRDRNEQARSEGSVDMRSDRAALSAEVDAA